MAVVYCNRCGAENQATRGACLRCFNPLDWAPAGLSCGSCGADNAAEARYCAQCSEALLDLPPMAECSQEAAITLILGAEDEIGPADDEDFIGGADEEEIAPAGVPEIDFEEEAEPELAAVPPPPPMEEESEEVIDVAMPPPPPPAPDEIDLGEEVDDVEEEAEEGLFEPAAEFAPPPPPPGIDDIQLGDESAEEEDEAEEDFAGFELAEEEEAPAFAPAAPVEEVEEDAVEGFEPLEFDLDENAEEEPVAEEEPAAEEAASDDQSEQGEDELGGWVIDFGDDE